MMKLTDTQKIAVTASHTDILVSAGAGAGKTRVLVERFLHFVTSGKARVTEILALTFTDKAANEMKSRIMTRFREEGMVQARRDLELAYISTIHAFAARLLKEHPVEARVPPDFSVIQSEESEALQERVLDELIEAQCLPGTGIFELLKVYGEDSVRTGLKKILTKARTEGLSLEAFFARPNPASTLGKYEADKGVSLFQQVKEPELGKEWQRFAANPLWDWKMAEDFREWSSGFNRKGGKETKPYWKEIVALCVQLEGQHLDLLAGPWREKFEKMALSFEAAYEALKFEKGVLDFDDLQIRALSLLTSPGPGNRKWLEHYRRHFKYILVDEYQDVNPLQVRLIECFMDPSPVPGKGKMFFVGDFKQSIYGFRGTSPQHFIEKQFRYQKKDGGLLIEMLENFRTQVPVLNFVNLFFEKLWTEDGLENTGLLAMAEKETSPKTPELLVVRKKAEESIEQARMREAGAMARKMRELHDQGIPYGDMTVLFQALTNAGIYEHALKSAGIPYFVISGRGFYHQPEIRDMMSLLGALENPLLDIPLAAALRSPLFHVSDETLFWLSRRAKKEKETAPLYTALREAGEIAEIKPDQKEILNSFQRLFDEMVQVKDRLYLSELLEWILRHTSYELPVLADRQGIRRYANLRKLVNLARNEESRGRMPLGDFIRRVQGFEVREIRESEAQVEAEESGRVVRLMTVHAAKGLEFPICFTADLAYKSANQESRVFVGETGLGYSFKIPNPVSLEFEKPGFYETILRAAEKRETEEWKRLFYVAVTRAKKQLILSGVYETPDEGKKAKDSFNEMGSWMEWMMEAAPELPVDLYEIPEDAQGLVGHAPKVFMEEAAFQKLFENTAPSENPNLDSKTRAEFSSRAEMIYRRFESREVPASRVIDLPVSAYCAFAKNKMEYWRIYEMGYSSSLHEPEYRGNAEGPEDSVISAADFGTLIHRALEVMDFKNPKPNFNRIVNEIFLGLDSAKVEEARNILSLFLESPLFKTLQSAPRIYKEIPFILNERNGRLEGVIDVLFQDQAGLWHIADYKTAVGDSKKVKEAAYDLQMGIYAAAAGTLLGASPRSAVLYFLKNQWAETLPLSPEFLSAQMDRVRALQQEMLSFRAQMTKPVALPFKK